MLQRKRDSDAMSKCFKVKFRNENIFLHGTSVKIQMSLYAKMGLAIIIVII